MKANQPKLLKALKKTVATCDALESLTLQERSRGRDESRRVEVYEPPSELDAGWSQINRVLFVTRYGWREGEPYLRSGYYISSLEANASVFAEGLRGHWLIENRLHYVKDVIANEDGSRIRAKQAAANLSLLKSLALNVYREQGHKSLKRATECFANKVKELLKILRT